MSRPISLLLAAALSLILAGCASFAGIYPQAKTIDPTGLAGSAAMQPFADWPREDWWAELHDPVLNGLIAQAFADSPSLQAAQARLTRAQAIADQAESALWPQVDAGLATTRQRFSEHNIIPPPYAGTFQSVNELRLSADWSVDFFGRNREELQAALGQLRASEVENRAARLLLATSVARSYYQLSRLLAQREVLLQRSAQRSDLATLVERRFKAGLDTAVELESARGVLPETGRDIAALDEQIASTRHALSLLLGQGPAAADVLAPALPAALPLALPERLPAELLGHRADVVAARWRVEAAVHELESTKALFYPNVNLRAFTGFSAIGFSHWLDAGSRTPGIGLAISLPIFDAGRLRNLYRTTAAQVDSAVASYNGTLLVALREVADQLSTLRALDIQRARQDEALASATRAYELAVRRYAAGITDRLNVLNVETNLLAQRRFAVDLQARWIDARIRLIDALGGGFAAPEATPPLAAAPAPLIAKQ
jgi:NodT family efflux transporter outer membrane factor (OMF) lipoprotein